MPPAAVLAAEPIPVRLVAEHVVAAFERHEVALVTDDVLVVAALRGHAVAFQSLWKATAWPYSCTTRQCTSITWPRSVLYQSSSFYEVNSRISSSSYSTIMLVERW